MSDKDILRKLQELDDEWNDTDAAQEGASEPLPEDDYELIVLDAEMAESQNGNVGLNVHFEVIKGEHEGRNVYHTFWLTKANLKYVKRDLGILGYEPESTSAILKAKPKLMHKKVVARLGQETYEGKTRNRVKWFRRIEQAQTAQNESADADFTF